MEFRGMRGIKGRCGVLNSMDIGFWFQVRIQEQKGL